LERLVRAHQAYLWRYLRFLGCAANEADDLTQETFLAVLGRPLHCFGPSGARAYLRRVARNGFLELRQRQAREPASNSSVHEQAFDWFCGSDDGERMLAALRHCTDTLRAPAREALTLRYVERLDRQRIAARLGLSIDGVKSLLQRSLARLRVCIQRRLGDA
jgi:RNA polymerase sigma-70 factor (ECF subfamily)